MPVPEGEQLVKEIIAFSKMNLIPIILQVFDQKTKQESDRYLLGCLAVPRVGEVVGYGETKVGVFGVRHEFHAAQVVPGTTIRVHHILVAGYEAE